MVELPMTQKSVEFSEIVNSDNDEDKAMATHEPDPSEKIAKISKTEPKDNKKRNKSRKPNPRKNKGKSSKKTQKTARKQTDNSLSKMPAMGVMTRRMKAELAKMDQKTD